MRTGTRGVRQALTHGMDVYAPSSPPRTHAWLAGVAAAAVALATGELVSAIGGGTRSLVTSVGEEFIDRAGGLLAGAAIENLGSASKAALAGGIVVVCLGLGAVLGHVAVGRRWLPPLAFGAFACVGVAAGWADPLTSTGRSAVAGVAAALAGWATLSVLLRALLTGRALPEAGARPIQDPADRQGSRRAFFGWAGAAGAFAAGAVVAGRALRGPSQAELARAEITLPTAEPGLGVREAAAGGGELDAELNGLSELVTPNDRFFRIDTAFVVPTVDPADWSLEITGMVDEPFRLTYDDLLALPMVSEIVTLACVSNPVGGDLVGTAVWQGVPLQDLLERAGVHNDATQLVGRSVDGFTVGFPTEVAFDGRTALVAVGMNGEPLPVRHGFPARLVVSGLFGYVSATKWLRQIELTTWDAFDAYWVPRGWAKEAPVRTQSRIDVPSGNGELDPGPVPVAGVAWAPGLGIEAVEVQVDDGPWREAELSEALADSAWRQWALTWDAEPGEHRLQVRATDGTGETQTPTVRPPAPSGATGWHARLVTVRS